ncbi:hypothetical protein RR42_s0106 [Cupriavidus basilensis]|uniref:Uncharacterized protein n=1 Tax=Cupriavidus basilensis TaxID=68895 RepID=A0A0C4YIP2_9BURK|nr:hypothetical protein RR42_s0106 [Cupriavidus basilensis]
MHKWLHWLSGARAWNVPGEDRIGLSGKASLRKTTIETRCVET